FLSPGVTGRVETAAHDAVLSRIKTPRTAIFGPSKITEERSNRPGIRCFVVESYVDAQNLAGAMVRQTWAAGVTVDTANKAEVLDVIFDLEQYSRKASTSFQNVATYRVGLFFGGSDCAGCPGRAALQMNRY